MANDQAAAPAIVTGAGSKGFNRPSRYEAPYWQPWSRPVSDRLTAWINEAIQEGEAFLRTQQGYQFVNASLRIMNDKGFDELPATLSKSSDNFVKRGVRELVGTLSNPRPLSAFRTENKEQKAQFTAELLDKGYISWQNMTFADRSLRKSLQYAAVEGTGYSLMEWDPGFWGTGQGDIRLTPGGVDMVLPIQISPDDWDLQKAYAVIIRRQLPITIVRQRFPLMADHIYPDGDAPGRWRRLVNGLVDKVTPTVHNTYGSQRGYRGEDPAGRNLVTIYDIYVMDPQVNDSGRELVKGVIGSPWEYRVPYLGQDIQTRVNDERTGMPITRKADYHDARIFPYRRHIVSTRSVVLYDDTSRWWHGEVPLIKYTLDDWPHEYCGIPVTKEPAKLQAMLTSLLRAYDDSANARLRPPVAFDDQRVSDALARSIDPRVGGQVVGMSNLIGEAFKLLVDPQYYSMQSDILSLIDWAKEEGTRLMGLHDVAALQKAGQIPSGDTLEKLTEMAGPLATDMSRNMEESERRKGEMFKALFFEFYTVKRRFQLFGPDGITPQDYDFDPASMVPADVDLPGIGLGGTRSQRARSYMESFHFNIVPGSIYQMTQSTRRLLILQLARMGLPIPPKWVMEQFDIPNPEKMIKEFWEYKEEEALHMTEIQIAVQSAIGGMDPASQLAGAIQGLGNKAQPGRPPTAQQNPQLQQKSDGSGGERTVISESG